MNTNTKSANKLLSNAELDALFARAAASQPNLVDENFTKMVVNSLPAISSSKPAKRFLPDLIGFVIGVLCILSLADPRQIIHSIGAALPETIVISPFSVLTIAAAISAGALFAWWSVEREA